MGIFCISSFVTAESRNVTNNFLNLTVKNPSIQSVGPCLANLKTLNCNRNENQTTRNSPHNFSSPSAAARPGEHPHVWSLGVAVGIQNDICPPQNFWHSTLAAKDKSFSTKQTLIQLHYPPSKVAISRASQLTYSLFHSMYSLSHWLCSFAQALSTLRHAALSRLASFTSSLRRFAVCLAVFNILLARLTPSWA